MTKQDFLNELAEIMQLDTPPTGSENLEDFVEWDSMANLGVMSMFDIEFGITLKTDDLKNIKTVSDLMGLAGDQITE
ncbi:MAG: acyl carrier protein [Moraxella osloensis]|nr:acyl carrier protein [Moraxella osloensis]